MAKTIIKINICAMVIFSLGHFGLYHPNVANAAPSKAAVRKLGTTLLKADDNQIDELTKLNGLSASEVKHQPSVGLVEVDRPADQLNLPPNVKPINNNTYQALATPNDPIYPQWYTDKISAPAAWDITTGNSNVTIAVIDTGFALNHQDLAGRWAENSAEEGMSAPGSICWTGVAQDKKTNNCDDDGDGFVDDWRGWDFDNNDNDPSAGTTAPNSVLASHGTMTAGFAAATGNNGVGVASINWGAKILPLQALDDNGSGYTDTIAAAIHYAANRGVNVISLSLGSTVPDDFMRAEIDGARAQGVTVVAAAGNSDCACMVYPANYPEVIAVGATDLSDNRASFSSYGSNLDVMAPGTGTIRTTYWTAANQTAAYTSSANGTSISTPIVAGLVGLIKGLHPSFDPDRIASVLTVGTDRVAGMASNSFTDLYGYGRINAFKALNEATYQASSGTVPVYRMANYITHERLFTINAVERDQINGRSGWVYEGMAFNSAPAGTTQVYRLANYISKERLFTTDANEKDVINGKNGWVYEGVAFLVDPTDTVPVYRLANYISKERLFTVSAVERDTINGKNGWVAEGLAFNAAP